MSRFEKGHQKINKTAKKGSKVEKKKIIVFFGTPCSSWLAGPNPMLRHFVPCWVVGWPYCCRPVGIMTQVKVKIVKWLSTTTSSSQTTFSCNNLRARPHHHIDATHLLAWLCAGKLGLLREDPAPPCLSSDLPTDMEKSEILAPTTFCLRKIAPKKRLKTPLI